MPTFQVHCEDCIRELGKPYEEVHKWLDELFKVAGPEHRDIRHNVLGVKKVREMWGNEAARAAEIHIIADEGWIPPINDAFKLRVALTPDIYKLFMEEYPDCGILKIGRFVPR